MMEYRKKRVECYYSVIVLIQNLIQVQIAILNMTKCTFYGLFWLIKS